MLNHLLSLTRTFAFGQEYANIEIAPPPIALEACILLYARSDKFVPPASTLRLGAHWGSGVEMRAIEGGHGSGFLLGHQPCRQAVMDALDRLSQGCRGGDGWGSGGQTDPRDPPGDQK